MIASVSQYILSVENSLLMFRTLRNIEPVRGIDGKPICYTGNSAIIFKVRLYGELKALRVYMRHHPNLRAIYRDNLYPRELFICHEGDEEMWADVVLCNWWEGHTLQREIAQHAGNSEAMMQLAQRFERFAARILDEEWAHGDIKPDNIIVDDEGMHLIDHDAAYRNGFTSEECIELGSRQYQHPARSTENFGIHIDDYPIALITTALYALAYDSSLAAALHNSDYLLINPAHTIEDRDLTLRHIEELFADRGDAYHLYIARLLHSRNIVLFNLRSYLDPAPPPACNSEELSLNCAHGLWGYTRGDEWIIPPLYDLGFEFSEGTALVQLGRVWHFIDEKGRTVITCGKGHGIKPMRDGKSHIVYEDGSEAIIYRNGEIKKI